MRVWSEGPLPWELLEAIHKAVRICQDGQCFSDFRGFLADSLWILVGFLLDSALYKSWFVPHLQDHWRSDLCCDHVAGWLCEAYPYPDAGAAWCSNQLNPIAPSAVVADCIADCVADCVAECSFPGHPHRLPMSRSHCGRRAGTPNTSRRRRFYRRVRRAAEPVYPVAKDWQRQDCSICAANVAISSVSTETTRNKQKQQMLKHAEW